MTKLKKINVCFITSSRSEYGLLKKLMVLFKEDKKFNLQLIVTGSHLSEKYANTYKEIIHDGFLINKKIKPINKYKITSLNINEFIGNSIKYFSKSFASLKTDLIILLGDRYELIAPGYVALIMKIPIAHIHGGEITRGSIDDNIRHTISKLSKFHFVANIVYKKRLVNMGENPSNVFVVGAMGPDKISSTKILTRQDIEKKFKFHFNKVNYLVTIHPETSKRKLLNISPLLDVLKKQQNCKIIFTGTNTDENSFYIRKQIKNFVKLYPKKTKYIESMGDQYYISTIKHVNCVIGNSSSGILEAPYMNTPTINLGTRQDGRLLSKSIITCKFSRKEISNAINQLKKRDYSDKKYYKNLPYGKKGGSKRVFSIIKTLKNLSYEKEFYESK